MSSLPHVTACSTYDETLVKPAKQRSVEVVNPATNGLSLLQISNLNALFPVFVLKWTSHLCVSKSGRNTAFSYSIGDTVRITFYCSSRIRFNAHRRNRLDSMLYVQTFTTTPEHDRRALCLTALTQAEP